MRNTTFKRGLSLFVAFVFLLTSMGPSVFAAAPGASGNLKLNFHSPPIFRADDTNQSVKGPKSLGMRITIPKSTTPYNENIRFVITGSAFTVNKFYLAKDANTTVSATAVTDLSVIASLSKPLPSSKTFSLPVHIGIVSGSALAVGETITITATANDPAHPTAIASTVITVIGKNATSSSKRSAARPTAKPASKPTAKPAAKPADKPKQTEQAERRAQTPADAGKSVVDVYKDVKPTDWFRADVEYAVKNGLFNGTSADKFSPDIPITRGMIVTVLGRLSGISESAYTAGGFRDTAPGQY
jgi:hypothetical protein